MRILDALMVLVQNYLSYNLQTIASKKTSKRPRNLQIRGGQNLLGHPVAVFTSLAVFLFGRKMWMAEVTRFHGLKYKVRKLSVTNFILLVKESGHDQMLT